MIKRLILALVIMMLFLFTPVASADKEPQKGLAMAYPQYQEDINTFDIEWWYVWGSNQSTDPKYVPMTWGGENPNLPSDYSGYILFLNEPDRPEQANITPENGVIIYKAFKLEYPNAKWVVGNVFWATWLYTFKDLCVADKDCILPDLWGIHAYVGNMEYLHITTDELLEAHDVLGGSIWITEWANVFGNISVDDALLTFFKSHEWIHRWAYFTNRSEGTEPWYPEGWNVQLIDWDTGRLTTIGCWYKNGLHKTLLPTINKN